MKLSTGHATAAAVSNQELFLGIDAAKTEQVVVRFVPGEGAKPAEGMLVETLLKRVARLIKDGFRVHCVYEGELNLCSEHGSFCVCPEPLASPGATEGSRPIPSDIGLVFSREGASFSA